MENHDLLLGAEKESSTDLEVKSVTRAPYELAPPQEPLLRD